jgi:hypothetical protein
LENGGTATIGLKDGALSFGYEPAKSPATAE